MQTKTKDPENYLKMSEPFETPNIANKALQDFHEEVNVLRKKYKIPDLLIVIKGEVKYPDGQIGGFMNHSSYGMELNVEPMAAYAYGKASAEHRELINKFLKYNEK